MAIQEINIGTVPNDGTGDDLRTGGQKINTNFDEVLNFTGGAQYVDSVYTSVSPFTILEGETGIIECDNSTVIDGNIPSDFTSGMFDSTTNKILAVNNKDRFITEIRFKAKNSINNGHFDIYIDIGGAVGVIDRQSISFTRSANTEQTFKPVFVYFTGTTFIANGGDIIVDARAGDLEIYDIEILPTRIHKGR